MRHWLVSLCQSSKLNTMEHQWRDLKGLDELRTDGPELQLEIN